MASTWGISWGTSWGTSWDRAVVTSPAGGGTLTPRHFVERVRPASIQREIRFELIEEDDRCLAMLELGGNPRKRREEELLLLNLLS